MRQVRPQLDGAAMGLSAICMLHCFALPLLVGALPLIAWWAEAEIVHVALLLAAAPLSATALLRPAHGLAPSGGIAAVGFTGLAVLAAALLAPEGAERALTLVGSGSLAAAHALNWRRRARRSAQAPGRRTAARQASAR